jgi:N,N'-diacetyllegionaminate synthase
VKKTFIIAEAGVNHNGDVGMALRLVDAAKAAGADAVKFQTGKPEKVIASWAVKANYQTKTTGANESQLDMVKKISLPYEDFETIKKYCADVGIEFFSTPFESGALRFLMSIGMRVLKIPSGEITNLPLLREFAKYNKTEFIISTGMANIEEIGAALQVFYSAGVKSSQIAVLHCNTEYPTPMTDVNLLAIRAIRDRYQVKVGYSDHTDGIEVPIAAVALGATVIEKHFTLDRSLPGPDHKASVDPADLKRMVDAIRNIELAIAGSGQKVPSPSETKNIPIARRSIMAARKIKKGDVLTEDALTTKRPGTGISPMKWDSVVGTIAIQDFEAEELIVIQ